MCDLEFNFPINNESLLDSGTGSYTVRNMCMISSLSNQLKQAKQAFQYDGPEYICNHFDTYYSVLHHADKINPDIIVRSIEDLTKPCRNTSKYLQSILEESDIETEVRKKCLNILKMYIYLYTKLLNLFAMQSDDKNRKNLSLLTKGRKPANKKKDDDDYFDLEERAKQLETILNILELPIYKLWDPPDCEAQFITYIADLCFQLLQNSSIKKEKEIWQNIFYIFGTLLKKYSYSMTFTIRLTQMIKYHDHLDTIVPEGIKIIVKEYNCSGLVNAFIQEVIDWQADENVQDAQASRNCALILTEMTRLMPELMLTEVLNLVKCLNVNSYTLRNCILSVITEVVIKVLCEEGMSQEQKGLRNKLLLKLKLHILDMNAHVRSKVLQNWTRLHTEHAIPLDMQLDVLTLASRRLSDKGALVRKHSVQLITTYLKCNPYAASLDLDYYEAEFEKQTSRLKQLKPMDDHAKTFESMKQKEADWATMEDKIRETIQDNIDNESEDDDDENTEDEDITDKPSDLEETIRMLLSAGKYKKAFLMCKEFASDPERVAAITSLETEDKVNFFVSYMRSIFNETPKNIADIVETELNRQANLTEEQMAELKGCETSVQFLTDVVQFLKIIDSILPIMTDLINSATMGDMNEAIEFFITAHQFQIKNTSIGLSAMLKTMHSTDQERKDAVIAAYKRIFLHYDGNPNEKSKSIVNRLIDLLKSVNINDLENLRNVITQWTSNGDLDNTIIELLWNMFTGRVSTVSVDDAYAALQLLAMAAHGRKTIVERNINLITELVFTERGIADPRLLVCACEMLSIMGAAEIDVMSKNPGFRIVFDDPMWLQLLQIVIKIYQIKDTLSCAVISAAVDLIYSICQKPDTICTKLIEKMLAILKDPNATDDQVDQIHLACFCHTLGEVAIHQFIYLDSVVYKELKRRHHMKDEQNHDRKTQRRTRHDSVASRVDISTASATTRHQNNMKSTTDDTNESFVHGATADDTDAEFILAVCEKELVTSNLLGQYAPLLVQIIKHPHRYADDFLQPVVVLALIRYMIVSSELCREHLTFIMTVLERSKSNKIKNNILIGLADLMHRFPNLIEPWTSQIFNAIKDTNESVRLTAVSVITLLIMEDMLRVKGTVADIALCIVDESPTIVQMTETFFHALAQKGNTIYNVLPDIISRLSNETNQIDEKVFQKVISFLISLIDKDKQIELFVEKLCQRFKLHVNERVCCDIAYCLTLVNYNEKSLQKLHENYNDFKVHLENEVVYDSIMTIIQKYKSSNKEEIKNLARQLDHLVRTGEKNAEEADFNVSSVASAKKTARPSRRGKKMKK